MRIFALGDPHLSFARPKPMHIFGENWRDHDIKISTAWKELGESNKNSDEDILILAGDLSWAMRMEEAILDLQWIRNLRGHKIIIRGNHDFWWTSIKKIKDVTGPTVDPLQAGFVIINRIAFVGTRGWQCPGNESSLDLMEHTEVANSKKTYTEQDFKIYEREVGRLQRGLETLEKHKTEYDKVIVILHYPPTNSSHEESGFTKLIETHQTDWCVYGHLHGKSIITGFNGQRGSTKYKLVSADSINFVPYYLFSK